MVQADWRLARRRERCCVLSGARRLLRHGTACGARHRRTPVLRGTPHPTAVMIPLTVPATAMTVPPAATRDYLNPPTGTDVRIGREGRLITD